MAQRGGQPGNANAVGSRKPWRAAIERAMAKRTLATRKEALDELAEKLLEQCDAGDMTALKELGDRLDGKSVQAIENGDAGSFRIEVVQTVVGAD